MGLDSWGSAGAGGLVPLLDAAGVRAAEKALFDAGLTVEALLETAVERVWSALADRFGPRGRSLERRNGVPRWLVLAGPGHNGADGWALARKAAEAGCEVDVLEPLAGKDEKDGDSGTKPLTRAQKRFAISQGVTVLERGSFTGAFVDARHYDLRVDAIFGFGLARDLDSSLVAFLRQRAADERGRPAWRVALDLPTGLCSDTGRHRPFALPSQETFVLGAMKPGLLSDLAPGVTGGLRYIPLGLREAPARAHSDRVFLSSPIALSEVCGRTPTEHKLSQGELVLVVGGVRYPGAGVLTLGAAQAARPGYVRLLSDSGETRTAALTLHPETLLSSLEAALASGPNTFTRARVGVLGCGMEAPDVTLRDAVFDVFPKGSTLVLDGTWCERRVVDAARARGHTVVLTPHAGEFARAFPTLAKSLNEGAIAKAEAARHAARESGCYLVLKGPCTALSSPEGDVWQSPLVNAELARAGSGDVLAGFLGGLLLSGLAKGHAVLPVLATGVWWHGSYGFCGGGERTLVRYLAAACAPASRRTADYEGTR